MVKVVAIHTISRTVDDGQTQQELAPGTVFEADGQELEDFLRSGAVREAEDGEELSDPSALKRSDASAAEPATTLINEGGSGAAPATPPKPAVEAAEGDEEA